MKKFFLVVAFAIAATIHVFAQDTVNQNLEGKLGIGFNTTWRHVPSLAVTYWLTDIVGVEGFTGFKISNCSYDDFFVIGGRALGVIRSYKDLNVFASTTLSLASGNSHTRAAILAGIGLEWFVLDNLSLSTEIGLRLSTGNGVTRFSSDIGIISVKFYM